LLPRAQGVLKIFEIIAALGSTHAFRIGGLYELYDG
jgi:hypothetical protein